MDNIFGLSTQESGQKMLWAEGFNSDAGVGISDDRSSNYNQPYKSPLKTKSEIPSLCSACFCRKLRAPS